MSIAKHITGAIEQVAVTSDGEAHPINASYLGGFEWSYFLNTSDGAKSSTTGVTAVLDSAPTVSAVGTHTHTINAPTMTVNVEYSNYNLQIYGTAGTKTVTTSSVLASTQTCSTPSITVNDPGHTHTLG